jgi:alkanesulfonate monooxygenase SsuD/methylene tetrahydromethanopterin reductase-like flavin-dependent oxidoreductase (luciferase family)
MARFQAERASGSLYIGSPETVATKIAAMMRLLGLSRFDLAYATGRVPHKQRLATIELYGREVIPRVRELLADHSVPSISTSYASAGATVQPGV